MSNIVRRCEANRSDGQPCNGIPREGDKWCSFHQKKYSKSVKHGKYASEELTGLKGKKLITFQEFLDKENPYNLDHEIALLRTLLLEQREAIERMSHINLEAVHEKYTAQVIEDLQVEGMSENDAEFVSGIATKRFAEFVVENYGETMMIGPSQLSVLVDTIESIAKTAERAKKIADGIVVNVSYRGVYEALMTANSEVLRALTTPDNQLSFVKAIENLNLLEQSDEDDWIDAEILG